MHLRSAVLGAACLSLVILVTSANLRCKKSARGLDYTGIVSTTKTGKECQPWASQSPHSHDKFTFPDGSEEAASNYCRNPDSIDGLWCYTTDPKTRWEYCDVADCAECKRSVLGTEYSGTLSKTVSGRTCQAWASQTPHNHQDWSGDIEDQSQEEAKNYCRNPDNTAGGPWCYTTDPNIRWEYCDVPFCDECKKTALGKDYLGRLSQTVSGRTCQTWSSQSPHQHEEWATFPEDSENDAANYCRNPDNTHGGPWCYTTDPDKRWEFCDVKFCEGFEELER